MTPFAGSCADYKGLMNDEKRAHPRTLAGWRASLVFENREVSTNLRNLSEGGAYLRIREEDAHKITSCDVGRHVQLRMEQGDTSVCRCGEISRYIQDDGSAYVAFRFTREPKCRVPVSTATGIERGNDGHPGTAP
jgi:hypothetical protein